MVAWETVKRVLAGGFVASKHSLWRNITRAKCFLANGLHVWRSGNIRKAYGVIFRNGFAQVGILRRTLCTSRLEIVGWLAFGRTFAVKIPS